MHLSLTNKKPKIMEKNSITLILKSEQRKKTAKYITPFLFFVLTLTSVYYGYEFRYLKESNITVVFNILCIFFLVLLLFSLKELLKDNFSGMSVSHEGINDIGTTHNRTIVQWKDVTHIRITDDREDKNRKHIVLHVKNPVEYIERESDARKKRSLVLKLIHYGSPICFSPDEVNCKFEKLRKTILNHYHIYKCNTKKINLQNDPIRDVSFLNL